MLINLLSVLLISSAAACSCITSHDHAVALQKNEPQYRVDITDNNVSFHINTTDIGLKAWYDNGNVQDLEYFYHEHYIDRGGNEYYNTSTGTANTRNFSNAFKASIIDEGTFFYEQDFNVGFVDYFIYDDDGSQFHYFRMYLSQEWGYICGGNNPFSLNDNPNIWLYNAFLWLGDDTVIFQILQSIPYNTFSGSALYNSYNGYKLAQYSYASVLGDIMFTMDNIDYSNMNYLLNTNGYYSVYFNDPTQQSINDAYNEGYNDAKDYWYQIGKENGEQIGYDNGLRDGQSIDQTTATIFSGIIQVGLLPVNFFLAIFNYEILGINISGLVSALMTIAVVIIVYRLVMGGKND